MAILRLRQVAPYLSNAVSAPAVTTPTTPIPTTPTQALDFLTAATFVATAPVTEAAAGAGAEAGEQGPVEDFGPVLNYSIWMMTGVSFIVVALRVYCKTSRQRRLWWDDWLLKLAWISLAIAAAMTSVSVSLGYGRNSPIGPDALLRLPTLANVAGFFSVMAAMWSKTSFALTLARISDGAILKLIWCIIVTMTAIMGSSAVLVFFEINTELKVAYFMFATSYSGAMDITLSILPWKIIWNLRMTRREKIGVLVAMSMGAFAGAISFVKVSKVPDLRGTQPVDSVQLVIFGIAEGASTIIAASIPVLRALIREGKPPTSPPPVELESIDTDKIPLRRQESTATEISRV
ncbi:uncharacterized protein DNG_09809 [Cephalotrichum gorgonifer]|uniref:Rhodopsin domain-containing protein n=1 Tax=Cephalotrichum gorgonifer TaxID=2041049 RepID=A0AAE8N6E1_9PEZI|nr:uncharacterized protein DNG_09809 [Cephalotrichum gorgonifer]